MSQEARYPALLIEGLTPVYDLFAKLFIPEEQFKRDLIAHAHLAPGQRVLDLGAGTGTLAIMVKQSQPQVQMVGLDGDPAILSIARQKSSRTGVEISFDAGNAVALPYPNQTFDRVLSTLVMSLLSREQKSRAIQEAYRVLRGSGGLYIADFGPPHTRWGKWIAPRMRRFEPISDNLDGLLPVLLQEAGFENIAEATRYATVLGTISILSGRRPL